MNAGQLAEMAARLCGERSGGNYVPDDAAITHDAAGLRMFDAPIVGVASAGDEYFTEFRQKNIIGEHFATPGEWLRSARSVVSMFFPKTARVKDSCASSLKWPSAEWLHARIEGQAFINETMERAKAAIEAEGYEAVIPSQDRRFFSVSAKARDELPGVNFSSSWSERHVAFVCGLGTFGLSKGLITRSGVAGRFGSIVTSLDLPPTPRGYDGVYDWCTMCGACARNCPANAISPDEGKNHFPCSAFLDETRKRFAPRYGCGKCQVKVPCQDHPPSIA
ncbi:MAG: 4Fe-4S binding protein [Synergistaceae bacterium]|jgi:epoxyqueuosine reductase QueG|nr:4Fe-4S binding protein [Synergistaceae bacterium]